MNHRSPARCLYSSYITAHPVSSFHHLSVRAAYPGAVAPGAAAAPAAGAVELAAVVVPLADGVELAVVAEPAVVVAQPVVVAARAARVVEPAPSVAERAAAVAEPAATGESVPVWSFFLFAAAAARPLVAAPKAHFELRAASVAAAFVFVPASPVAAAVM